MKRLQFIDGLRIVMAIVVVFHHLVSFFPWWRGEHINTLVNEDTPIYIIIPLAPFFIFNGYICVDMFFLIVGYTTFYYIDSRRKNNKPLNLGSSIVRRSARLLPMLIFVQIVCFLLYYYSICFVRKYGYRDYSFRGLKDIFTAKLNGPLFVLKDLYFSNIFAYALHYILTNTTGRVRYFVVIGGCVFLVGNGFNASNFIIVVAGSLLYYICGTDLEKVKYKYILALAPLWIVPYLQILTSYRFNDRIFRLPISISVFILLSKIKFINKVLSHWLLTYAGLVGYEMYLSHLPIMVFFDEVLLKYLKINVTNDPFSLGILVHFSVLLFTIANVSVLMYFVNKYTFVNAANRLLKKLTADEEKEGDLEKERVLEKESERERV